MERRGIRNRLRAARKRRGLTQTALAQLVERSQTMIWAIERGFRAPTPETRKRFAKILATSEAQLFPNGGRRRD